MFYHLATAEQCHTHEVLRRHWSPLLREQFVSLSYREVLGRDRHPGGIYIFSDIERLTPEAKAAAGELYDRMVAAPGFRALTDPRRVPSRLELLRALHARGTNAFSAWPACELPDDLPYPVFVRHAWMHSGSLSRLVCSRRALERALRIQEAKGRSRANLLVVQYVDTQEGNGLYRKCASSFVDGAVLPRHRWFSREWAVKSAGSRPVDAGDEADFLRRNPFRDEIRQVFDLAHVQYGRLDFGVYRGRLQVWEINTNPTVTRAPSAIAPERLANQRAYVDRLTSALQAAAEPCDARAMLRWEPREVGVVNRDLAELERARPAARLFNRWTPRRLRVLLRPAADRLLLAVGGDGRDAR